MTIGCMLSSTGVYCFAVSAGVPVTGQYDIYIKPFKIALKSHFSLINKGF